MESSLKNKVVWLENLSGKENAMDSCEEKSRQMSLYDESYLCLLSLRDSTGRIARLYYSYIQLRQMIAGEAPPVLITMLLVLQKKKENLHRKLLDSYPDYMTRKRWHNQDEQVAQLAHLSEESRADLQQICSTEMKLLVLISEMDERLIT